MKLAVSIEALTRRWVVVESAPSFLQLLEDVVAGKRAPALVE